MNQIEVNPIVAHTELRQAVTERGIAVVSWSPLGKDLLHNASEFARDLDGGPGRGADPVDESAGEA